MPTYTPPHIQKNGQILPSEDSPFGFTSNQYEGWMWRDGDAVYISFIRCLNPMQGHFRTLVANILAEGLVVKVPTPLGGMKDILDHMGFRRTIEKDEMFGSVEVWVK